MIIETSVVDLFFGVIFMMAAGMAAEKTRAIKDVKKDLPKAIRFRLRPVRAVQVFLLFGGIAVVLWNIGAPVTAVGFAYVAAVTFVQRAREVNYQRWVANQAVSDAIKKALPF